MRQGLLITHLRRSHRAAGFSRGSTSASLETIPRLHGVFGTATANLVKLVGQRFELDVLEFPRDAEQRVLQPAGLNNAGDQVAGTYMSVARTQPRSTASST